MQARRTFTFCASHILPRHEGKCSRLHGHNWEVIVEVFGNIQKETGFVMDFAVLKKVVQPLIDRFDHRHMNCFVRYPSSENIAAHIAHYVRAELLVKYSQFNLERLVVGVSETSNTLTLWDSAEPDDTSMLDVDDETSEWRSPAMPEFTKNLTVDDAIEFARQKAQDLFESWETWQTGFEQLQLYVDSIDRNPALPDFAAAKKAEQEAADDARKAGQ